MYRAILSDSCLARRSLDDLDNLTGTRIDQHSPLIHNRVAVRIAKAHTRRNRSKASTPWRWLTHSHWFGGPD
jgi:hypothetical protein